MGIERIAVDRDTEPQSGLKLPFDSECVKILQGYDGPFSHFAMKRVKYIVDDTFCIDFKLPLKTPVLAAKSGVVYGVISCNSKFYRGLNFRRGMGANPNFIVLRHGPGEFTVYSHLGKRSSLVREEEVVEQGQPLASTGMSGWVGPKPHLHFCFYRNTELCKRTSFPVIFDDYDGPLYHSQIAHFKK